MASGFAGIAVGVIADTAGTMTGLEIEGMPSGAPAGGAPTGLGEMPGGLNAEGVAGGTKAAGGLGGAPATEGRGATGGTPSATGGIPTATGLGGSFSGGSLTGPPDTEVMLGFSEVESLTVLLDLGGKVRTLKGSIESVNHETCHNY